jgi:membrane protein implicated in regulation of membrane protease activity
MWWQLWWVWVAAGGLLAIAEVLLPGFVLLGFAVGAVLTGVLVLFGVLGASAAPMIFVFAVASLVAWFGLRAIFGRHEGQVKVWTKDVND